MFMTAGGHFAGMIVRVSRPGLPKESTADGTVKKGKGGGTQKPQPEMQVLAHKTFHRYTTRRKQGGSQSVNDNAKGPAKSAGAQLRRYGEQALREVCCYTEMPLSSLLTYRPITLGHSSSLSRMDGRTERLRENFHSSERLQSKNIPRIRRLAY